MRAILMAVCAVATAALFLIFLNSESKPPNEIGHSLGKTIYRDDIQTNSGRELARKLYRRIVTPVMKEYQERHLTEIEPTKAECEMFLARLAINMEEPYQDELFNETKGSEVENHLKMDGTYRQFAKAYLKNWKTQRYLYENYGGGRILFQQTGYEAFDAMLRWLEEQEQDNKFAIYDKELRREFYNYWTEMEHGSFLTSDKDTIRDQFLTPEWLREPNLSLRN